MSTYKVYCGLALNPSQPRTITTYEWLQVDANNMDNAKLKLKSMYPIVTMSNSTVVH